MLETEAPIVRHRGGDRIVPAMLVVSERADARVLGAVEFVVDQRIDGLPV